MEKWSFANCSGLSKKKTEQVNECMLQGKREHIKFMKRDRVTRYT